MHVLITADTVGGVWTYTSELVAGLARRGIRVTLVSFGDIPAPEQCTWMEGLPALDYRPTAFRLEWMQESEADLEASSSYLEELVRELRPDLLHLSQYCYGALRVGVPKLVVAHSDVVSWWHAVHGEEPRDSAWIRTYRRVVARGLAAASAVVAPSAWMLRQIVRHYGRPAKTAVIYNGRTPSLFNPFALKDDLVVSVGRLWDAGKQISLLLEQKQKVPVCLAGSSAPSEAAEEKQAFAAGGGIYMLGRQSQAEIANLLSHAAIYVAASRYEPFGLAPLEAALSRCALILNDIPSFREIWGDAALYFARNSAESLGETLAEVRSNKELRARLANRAYARACGRYSAERMVSGYCRFYARLVARRKPAGEAAAAEARVA